MSELTYPQSKKMLNPNDILFRRAYILTLALSLPCLLGVSLSFLGPRDLIRALAEFYIQIGVAFCVMFAFGWVIAPIWGPRCTRNVFLAGIFGFLVFAIGLLSGAASSMLLYRSFAFFDYVVKPAYWFGMFGAIPSFIVGVVGFCISRYFLKTHITSSK